MWASLEGQYGNKTDYVLCGQRWKSPIQQQKQDWEWTVAQIVGSLLQNSGLN